MKWIAQVTFLLSLIPMLTASAQHPGPASPEHDKGWFSFGVGPGLPYDLSGVVSANFGRHRVIQLAYHGTADFTIGDETTGVDAVSACVGLSRVDRIGRVAAFVGPAWVSGNGPYDAARRRRERFQTIGLVASVQLVATPVKEIGLGIDLYGNLNLHKVVGGLSLTLVFEGNK